MHLATVASASLQEQPPSHQAQAQPRLLRRRATVGGTVVGSPPSSQHHFRRRPSSTGVKLASYGVGHQRTVLGSPPSYLPHANECRRTKTKARSGRISHRQQQVNKKTSTRPGSNVQKHGEAVPSAACSMHLATIASATQQELPSSHQAQTHHRLLRHRVIKGGTVVGTPPNKQHHCRRKPSSTGVDHASYGFGHQRTVLGAPPRQATQIQNGTAEKRGKQNHQKGNTTSTRKVGPPGSQAKRPGHLHPPAKAPRRTLT